MARRTEKRKEYWVIKSVNDVSNVGIKKYDY